ncbi:MAG TPA: phosphomethylpyrimidine synthase ThiC, partial [Bacillota bacterium]|nr:phosphomethylpyrimidine synthase ThiC [Bacillota bacterium]
AARQGIVTREMKIVAEKEGIAPELLRDQVARGEVAIPANRNHRSLNPEGVGKGLRTKINVNLGVSRDCCDFSYEMEKVRKAIALKAEAIMDLSSYGKTHEFRTQLIAECPAMIGTVPIYDASGFYERDLKEISAADFIRVIEVHARDGVDFMTIHAGLTREIVETLKKTPRVTNIVSRGGSLIAAWMELTGNENPFLEHFDEILAICAEYDVTISLGDACRPGSIADATDQLQIQELVNLGALTLRAWERNVQVMIEGPGHMALNEIAANMLLEKKLCHGAPFYVLGPLVTDVAPGYDHITSAIGGAVAAMAGADFLCYVTPAEHLRLPNLEDLIEGVVAAKIAAHAGDVAKGIRGAKEWDLQMSQARAALDWEQMFNLALEQEKPRRYRAESQPHDEDSCTMCGKMCAVRNMNRVLKGEAVSLMK